jgi:3-methylcrotonyl-CoA carboxylase alpha subunit
MGSGPLRRVLIANRGEIAVRVARACRELGVESVAAYTADERDAAHVAAADDAVEIPGYLEGDAIIAAAASTGSDAVHPGYGFLAERAGFAEAVLRAGIRWIGPPPEAMRLLGDKVEARRLAEASGVPVVPGYAGVDLTDDALLAEARRLGVPLLVKAAAGGGGRGMRSVDDLADVPEALAAARREAAAAFGDDRVFLERRLGAARHVEVQLLADAHGHAVHLGERDCSLQRRHQKVVEESPSPAVDPYLRAAMGEAAVALARAAGYVNAGTAEFLLAADGSWCFLELNARLQVEHPVTEAVTGIDLVRAQLEIAGGAPLELEQDDIRISGHAIEARLYAEDPAAGFLPATGRVELLDLPRWPGVRVDTSLREGDLVGLRYDPLLAKIVAHAEDRDACVARLEAALAETRILGVITNLGFLRWALAQPGFRAGEATTGFIDAEWGPGLIPPLPEGVSAEPEAEDAWSVYGNRTAHAEVTVRGRHALHLGWAFQLAADDQQAVSAAPAGGSLSAPMPGTVLRVAVDEGDEVTEGQVLVLLEAMKMELSVQAPASGVVRTVLVSAGDVVGAGQSLLELEQ